jgi:hypothetical protein
MGCAKVPLIEPLFVPDVFVSGVANIEMLGSSARFVLYTDRFPADGRPPEREVVAKLVVGLDCLPLAMRKTLRFMEANHIPLGERQIPKLVK